MQQRHQIRETLGALEERMDELASFARSNERALLDDPASLTLGTETLALAAQRLLRELAQLVQQQQLQKSVSAADFLNRVCGLLVQEAGRQGVELAISHYGEGRISMEMAELVMGAVLSGLRASVRNHRGFLAQARMKKHLFCTASVYLEVRAGSGELEFRLLDDSRGFVGGPGADAQLRKLREHVARGGGWFRSRCLPGHGGAIELKMPLSGSRVEALLVRSGGAELLIPKSCIAETRPGPYPGGRRAQALFRLCEEQGLVRVSSAEARVFLRLCVADLDLWLACEEASSGVMARRLASASFVKPASWIRVFGAFQERGEPRLLPLLDGSSLLFFAREKEVSLED